MRQGKETEEAEQVFILRLKFSPIGSKRIYVENGEQVKVKQPDLKTPIKQVLNMKDFSVFSASSINSRL